MTYRSRGDAATGLTFVYALLLLGSLAGCQCRQQTMMVTAEVSVEPAQLDFGRVYLGRSKRLTLTLQNAGRAPTTVTLSTAAPFTVEPSAIEVAGGEVATAAVSLTASEAAEVTGELAAGSLRVPLRAEVLAVPACAGSGPCAPARFDFETETCVETPLAEGAACQTVCSSPGVCSQGACVGEAASCVDTDACTVDACGAGGCVHVPRVCPAPSNPCLAPRCDSTTGCGSEPVPDGTLCGPDECLATQLDVCIAGQCVRRTRPASGRCSNTWVTVGVTPGPIAFDEARGLAVLLSHDSWTFDGQQWSRRTPTQRPPLRGPLAYDAARQRVVVFASSVDAQVAETWEWDGVTWLNRSPPLQPRRRSQHAMTYDSVRRRVVLFGGSVNNTMSSFSNETWEWDGHRWELRQPLRSPPETSGATLAFDPLRRRVVLFGGAIFIGSGSELTQATWEYDGTTWSRAADGPSLSQLSTPAMAFDSISRRVLLVGQSAAPGVNLWAWDGTSWASVSSPGPSRASVASDPRGGVLALDERAATWRWDGTSWRELLPRAAPTYVQSVAYDAERQNVVAFADGETWLWNGSSFQDAGPAPSGLTSPKLFFDEARRETVAVGGVRPFEADAGAWTWNGVRWAPGAPLSFGEMWTENAAATWDVSRQTGVVISRYSTYEYQDGGWQSLGANGLSAVGSQPLAAAYDRARDVTVVKSAAGRTFERRDGGAWVAVTDGGVSPYGFLAAYDENSTRVVGLGASYVAGGYLATMFGYDGVHWSVLAPGKLPSAEVLGVLTFDRARQRLTLFQGPVVWVYLPP